MIVQNKIWLPAGYLRLSKEDKENGNDVSISIKNQDGIINGFTKGQNWKDPLLFIDDDRTGTNFNREDFQKLYAACQKGIVNVVIVHDITRFGRNWVQSGYYFEKLMELGVRFISLAEGIDTADPNCPGLQVLPFYMIFAEWYSSSISKKIRTVFDKQNQEGKHRSFHAPYGYMKDPNDKYKLVVDPITAPIVKRIFDMRLQKQSFGVIARTLNRECILSPFGYCADKYDIKSTTKRNGKWSPNSVIGIISNPTYCGDVVQNRVGCISYKNQKQVRKGSDEWIIVRDMHEALVSREDFQTCADMRDGLGRIRSTQYAEVLPLTGLLICADCGYKMQRTSTYYDVKATGERKLLLAYNCGAYANMGKTACTSHYILETDLKELLIADIQEKAGEIIQNEDAVRERYYAIKSQSGATQLNAEKNSLKKVNKRLAELEKLIQAAFEKSVLDSDMSDTFSSYARNYESEKKELTQQAKQLTASIDKQSKTENDVETFIALMKKYANITDLDRATAVELIDHITISASAVKPREITIFYNLIGNIE